ncbi:MAG: threonine--tRNA ligase [Candidatus Promineifilaceae bacterium]|nr:threonine--tRNA ligase [Candidatus Promineifilaceae bacterium]
MSLQDNVHGDQSDRYEESDLYRLRHTAAHVMAQAVLELYPGAKLGIGPPIADGFYYDFDLGQDEAGNRRTFSPDDLEAIERRMRQIIASRHLLVYREIDVDEARRLFQDQPYKLELIAELAERGERLSTYRHDTFEDLCRGPHVAHTGKIPPDAIRLTSVAGAYWRGDEANPMLQRIYGTAWPSKRELKAYIRRVEEAKRRDHRRLGKQMELFHFDETAPGMPYWLPNGLKILRELIAFWREEHEKRGYQEIAAPLVNDVSLWKQSGHWEHYRENMFIIPIDEQRTYALKPMNCPNAMIVYGLKTRSYRDLPLRLADTDVLHRRERTGTLHGLLRVQHIQQDDAHIFVTEEQIEEEYNRILNLVDRFYDVFGLTYQLRLSTRPERFIGDVDTWNKAEAALKRILDARFGPENYQIDVGDGAFYGPKIDIDMADALGRQWQMGTVQLDFQLPRRFGLTYVDENGEDQTPVVIHRVVYGAFERFVGILIEHFNGAFPVWLAPVQAVVIPITDDHHAYVEEVTAKLRAAGVRAEADLGGERMQAKIRHAQLLKVPYMLIAGDREVEAETVSLRKRDGRRQNGMAVEAFLQMVEEKVHRRAVEI